MKPFPIPIIPVGGVGPGSQPDEEGPDCLDIPTDMRTFARPSSDFIDDPKAVAAARSVLIELRAAMQARGFVAHGVAAAPVILDLIGRPAEEVRAVNEALGDGEVSIVVRAPAPMRIQETAFAGVWRVLAYDAAGLLVRDAIEACALPPSVIASARAAAARQCQVHPAPEGLMNAPALLSELQAASERSRDGAAAEVLNLTLLPLSAADLSHLDACLGAGSVTMLSRGYGNCRIASTALHDTWWVQYFNSMDRPILNTLEVVDVPEVALAAREDWDDSIERLGEWIVAMTDS